MMGHYKFKTLRSGTSFMKETSAVTLNMVITTKYIKTVFKASFAFTVVFVIFNVINGLLWNDLSRHRIVHFHAKRISNYYANNPKIRFQRNNLMYLLIWTKKHEMWGELKDKREAFVEKKCRYDNCYVTDDRNLLGNDYKNFDAILIDGLDAHEQNATLPMERSPVQVYVFAARESADNYPVCDEKFDNYFNLTWTYRLDSDVPWHYFSILDLDDNFVGPAIDMSWAEMENETVDRRKILLSKMKPGVWFVSNCYTQSRRETVYNKIRFELKNKYGFTIDSVGNCGSKECPKDDDLNCVRNLEKYYFYFAFENSLSPDYVTEKVLKGLLYNSVPVVFGGANYSRFLPPNSYIDASRQPEEIVAAKLAHLIKNLTAYAEFFRWQNHYKYVPRTNSACDLCEALNKFKNFKSQRRLGNFRKWWNPNFRSACSERSKRAIKFKNSTIPLDSEAEVEVKRLC